MRLLSMAWAVIRLYGFTITRIGDDLRTEFGLLTRVVATIPIQRIQTLTIREGPLHRLFGRAVGARGHGGRRSQRSGCLAARVAGAHHRAERSAAVSPRGPSGTGLDGGRMARRRAASHPARVCRVAGGGRVHRDPARLLADLVGSRRHRAAHRLGGARRAKNDRSPRTGRRRPTPCCTGAAGSGVRRASPGSRRSRW